MTKFTPFLALCLCLTLPLSAQQRIGIIGLDTSHSTAFTKLMNTQDPATRRFEVVAAYPWGSSVIESAYSRIPKYTEDVRQYGVKITDSIAELLEMVDCVLLETNDGHLHLEQAAEVFKAGKKIYIDKPLGATLAEAIAIYTLAERYGATFFSSSAVRFTPLNQEIRTGKYGRIIGADCYSPHHPEPTHPDFGYYGLHGVEELYTVMGTGCEAVSRVHTETGDVVTGRWSDGRIGTFRAIIKGPSIYGGTAFTEKEAIKTGGYTGYQPLVDAILRFFETGVCPIEKEETLEIFAFMEASNRSLELGGKTVSLRQVRQEAEEEAVRLLEKCDSPVPEGLVAERIYSGFPDAHDTYNAISAASDGKIYYVLSSERYDVGGQMYRYDPATGGTEFIADLSQAVGEKRKKYIAQGKSHVEFVECDGKLWFATHAGYYQIIDGAEQMPVTAPKGWKLYPGGHFLSYDLATGRIEDLALAPAGDGIITMAMDTVRRHLFGLTWPHGRLIDYDIPAGTLRDLGPVTRAGETGLGTPEFRVICRSMFVDPRDGNVYWSTADGDIWTYNPSYEGPHRVEGVDLRLDYFGQYDPADAGSMGYNWRKIFWYAPEGKAYGVHGNSGYLFSFDPVAKKVEIIDRITSEPSRRSGMGDQFSYGYLGFRIADDGTIYYLTGAPIYQDGKRVSGLDKINMGAAKGLEYLHLVTYNIPRKEYLDLGPVFYEDGTYPTYVNSIAIGERGDVYTLARFQHEGRQIEDLIRINLKY